MKRPAFTILELLIALSLFLVGMVSILEIFPVDRNLLSESTHQTQASYLAQQEMEEMVATPYANLTTGVYVAKSLVTTDTTSEYSIYSQEVDAAYIDTNHTVVGTDDGLKKITVIITWKERTFNQSYTLTTYVHS